MIRRIFTAIMLGGIGAILLKFLSIFGVKTSLPAVAQHYITNGPKELGASNIVTSVVVTYRGLDTLGEVTILFASAAVVALLLYLTKSEESARKEGSELLKTGTTLLFPLILLLGVYVFVNGHLTPGGGFQGGAIIASALMLSTLANPNKKIGHTVLSIIESISGVTYVALGTIGIAIGGGFLDSRLISLGEYGSLLSAGLIPIIYILIGLKVGAELGSIVVNMQGDSTTEEV